MPAASSRKEDQILQKVRIPITDEESIEVELNTSKEKISKLTSRIITDDDFRVRFNKAPEKLLEETGIYIKPADIEKLKLVPITEMVKNSEAQAQCGMVFIIVFLTLIPPVTVG